MMQRILIVENRSLFGAGIESLLAQESDFEIVGCSPKNEMDLISIVGKLKPDLIIIHDISIFTDPIRMLTHLTIDLNHRLLMVSNTKNLVCLYLSGAVPVTSGDSLVALIRQPKMCDKWNSLGDSGW